jgi:hypothetical protein
VFGLAACEGDTTTSIPASQTVGNSTFDAKASVQGTVFDATTGERIGGSDLEVTLIQGTNHRDPNVLVRSKASVVGEYGFSDIPITLDSSNADYKIIVTNSGYQRFEGYLGISAANPGVNNTLDGTYNFIRDVYIFPVGATAPDLTVAVEFDREPVVGATVLLQQNANSNVAPTPTSSSSHRVVAAQGYIASRSGTTALNANGVATVTFLGSSLVLGGAYTPRVLPVVHEGLPLTSAAGTQVIVGATEDGSTPTANVLTQVVTLFEKVPGTQDDGIHVVFASNRDTDDITGIASNPGRLVIVFNRAVAINSSTTSNPFTATLASATQAVLTSSGASGSVSTSLSSDGLTLTLDPVFTTVPDATDVNLDVVYAGGRVTVSGDEGGQANTIFGTLTYLDGTAVSGTVNVLGP